MAWISEYNLRRIIQDAVREAKDDAKGPSEEWVFDPRAAEILRELANDDWRGVVRVLVRHIARLDERIDKLSRTANES